MTKAAEFEEFMRNYQNMVYSTAVRLLGNQADAADVAQDVFLKAFASFDDISTSPRAGGWLRTVTTNHCLNHLSRYRSRWKFFSEFFSHSDEEEQDYAATLPAPEAEALPSDTAQQHGALEMALRDLPDAQRVPMVLFHFEEMSYEEIARRLRVSVGKIKTDIHRGRVALKKKLRINSAGEIVSPTPEPPQSRQSLMGAVW